MGPGVYFTPVPETADNSAFRKGSVFAGFAVAKRPKYKKNLLDIINHDEVNKIVSLLLPKKIIDKLPETSLFNFNYDSSFGGSTDPEKPLDLFKFPKHTRVEEMVNVVLNDPQQVLIIPSPIQKIDKPVKDWDT
jgi:hypothetical protein